MTLSDFATFCTAISGLAVTASLIYLGLQTYQSTKHTRALMSEEMFGTSEVAYSSFLQQPGMRAFWQSWKELRKRTAPKFIAWVDRPAATSVASSNPNWI